MEKLFVKISGPGYTPEYAKHGDAGCDLRYYGEKNLLLPPGKITLVPTGICMEIPYGYEGQVRPKSGLSLKGIIAVLGTVDSGYRGEVGAIIHNVSHDPYILTPGLKVAQMVFNKVEEAVFVKSAILEASDRGIGGFGHTGV